MRSRYTAHAVAAVGYLRDTLTPEARKDFDEPGTRKWAQDSTWMGLKILATSAGGEADTQGTVEFVATYESGPKGARQVIEHREISTFGRTEKTGKWLFASGQTVDPNNGAVLKPVVRDAPKVGRNDLCPCGSGKKYKKCHG